jgi:hypothetical protein
MRQGRLGGHYFAVKDQTTSPTLIDTAARQRAIDAALSQMDKQFGKGSVLRLGSRSVLPVAVISSGSGCGCKVKVHDPVARTL